MDKPHRRASVDAAPSQPAATFTSQPVERDVISARLSALGQGLALGLGQPRALTPRRPLGGNSAALHWGPLAPGQGGSSPMGKPPLPFHRSPSGGALSPSALLPVRSAPNFAGMPPTTLRGVHQRPLRAVHPSDSTRS